MFKKNDIIDLEITGLTNEGCGIGKSDGIVIFVPFSAVGDILKVRILKVNKSHCYGKIENITDEVGFKDAKSFCRVFKKHTGISPSQYRKYYGKNDE